VCFERFEEHALTSLQKTGRARNWTSTQAIANLWTKKGYDVVIKSCGCLCDNGFVRKDLDYRPPKEIMEKQAEAAKPKKKKDLKQEEDKKKEIEKKAKKVARRMMEEEDDMEEEVEYFDRPGSLTLNAALQPPHEKTPAEREAEKRDKAEKQRLLARQREEQERKEREQLMARRENERKEQEKAEKLRKEAERQEAIERSKREEEEASIRRKEEEEKKSRQREKQKQREEEKKREQAKIDAEARERRKKFEREQAMMAKESDTDKDKEAENTQQDEFTPAEEDSLFWLAADEVNLDPPVGGPTSLPPGFGDTLGIESFVGGLMEEDPSAYGAQAQNTTAQISKLQAQVASLQESLGRVLAELACEQKLRQMEDERLERVTQSMGQRQEELKQFQMRWGEQIRSLC